MKTVSFPAKVSAKIVTTIRQLDAYGEPISFKYNGSSQYKSAFGGVMTILSRIILLIYFIVQLSDVYNKKSTIKNLSYNSNLMGQQLELNLQLDNFDFAVEIDTMDKNKTMSHSIDLDEYYYVTFFDENYYIAIDSAGESHYVTQQNAISKQLCGKGRFLNQNEQMDALGIPNEYSCPKDINFTILGKTLTSKTSIIGAKVNYCNQTYLSQVKPTKICKTTAQTDEISQNLGVQIAFLIRTVDPTSFSDNPINSKISVVSLPFIPGTTMIQELKTKKRYATLKDSWLSSTLNEQNHLYFDSIDKVQSEQTYTSDKGLAYIFFTADDYVDIIDRQVFTLWDALTNAGGISAVITAFFSFVTSSVQEILFRIDITGQLYQKQKKNSKKNKNTQDQTKLSPQKIKMTEQNTDQKFDQDLLKSKIQKQILLREYLVYRYWRYARDKVASWIFRVKNACKRMKIDKSYTSYESKLFSEANAHLDKDFDIIQLFKNLRQFQIISDILLSKNQKLLLPYLKQNVIDYHLKMRQKQSVSEKLQDMMQDQEQIQSLQLQKAIDLLFDSNQYDKFNQRILKNLVIDNSTLKADSSQNWRLQLKNYFQSQCQNAIVPYDSKKLQGADEMSIGAIEKQLFK